MAAGGEAREAGVEGTQEKPRKLQSQSSLRVRQRTEGERGVWVRTTTPSSPRDVSRFPKKRGGKEAQGEWRPSSVCSSKGGKGKLHFPTGSAQLRLRPDTCRHLAPSEAPQTNPIPGVP